MQWQPTAQAIQVLLVIRRVELQCWVSERPSICYSWSKHGLEFEYTWNSQSTTLPPVKRNYHETRPAATRCSLTGTSGWCLIWKCSLQGEREPKPWCLGSKQLYISGHTPHANIYWVVPFTFQFFSIISFCFIESLICPASANVPTVFHFYPHSFEPEPRRHRTRRVSAVFISRKVGWFNWFYYV